jgi:hypothetical protein
MNAHEFFEQNASDLACEFRAIEKTWNAAKTDTQRQTGRGFDEWWNNYQLQRLQGNMFAGFPPADAWNAAKADAEMDAIRMRDRIMKLEGKCLAYRATINRLKVNVAGWTAAAYEDGGLAMEARYEEKITRYLKALDAILKLTSEGSSYKMGTKIIEMAQEALKEVSDENDPKVA